MEEQDVASGIHFPHDKGYKFLLSSKKMFIELLRSFVRQGWVEEIDESDIVPMDKSYILPDFEAKEADLVYRLKLKGNDIIFYVLIELQSSVDHLMPFRLLLYKTEVWRDVLKNTSENEIRRKDFKLPVIVPIVLYDGDGAWTANRRFRPMLSGEHLLGDELLDFQYILLDVQRYTEEELLDISNMVSSAFLLDHPADADTFVRHFRHVLNVIEQTPATLRNQLMNWMKHIVLAKLSTETRQRLEQVLSDNSNNQEVSGMSRHFAENLDRLEARGEARGEAKGIKDGIEKVARNLLKEGMDPVFVAKVTGLPEEEARKLAGQ